MLIAHWFHSESNNDLFGRTSEQVLPDDFENNVAEALARSGTDKREHLLCALLLDERAEVRNAVTEELRRELAEETSELIRHASSRRQELEKEWKFEQQLKAAQDETSKALEQLEKREQETNALQAQVQEQQASIEDLQGRLSSEQQARQKAEDDCSVSFERARHSEEQRSRLETDKTTLEREIRDLQQQLTTRQDAEKHIEELERAQQEWADEKRRMERLYRHLEKEHRRTQRKLEDEIKHPRTTVSLASLDESWREVIPSLAVHLRVKYLSKNRLPDENINDGTPVGAPEALSEWAADWREWQQLESQFARHLLQVCASEEAEPQKSELEEQLIDAKQAQKLLVLRWYLLEGFRLRVLESLRADNLANATENKEGSAP